MNKSKVIVNIDDKSKADLVNKFNHEIRWLMKKIYIVSNKSISVQSMRNQLLIGINADAEIGLIYAGPEIYGFRDAIRKKNVDYFCSVDYSSVPRTGKIEYDQSVITLLQAQMPKCTDFEKDEMFSRIENMLDMYLEYIMFTKAQNLKDEEIKEFGFRRISASEYKAISEERAQAKRDRKKKKKQEEKNNKEKTRKGPMNFPISDSEDSSF